MKHFLRPILGLALGLCVAATATADGDATPAAKASLFERLGGKPGTSRIASAFIDELAGDARLMKNPRFAQMKAKVKLPDAKARFGDELCNATGGPCKLNPKPLIVNAPAPSTIAAMEWFYIIDDANAALDKANVPARERGELLSLLMKKKG